MSDGEQITAWSLGITPHERAAIAKTDYLAHLGGAQYRQQVHDIEGVFHLLESPIEQVAIFQLAGENYAYRGAPVYAKVALERGLHSSKHFPVQIIPQVKFGPYRVDFLIDIGPRGMIAVECDGAEFHRDKERDDARDAHLREHFNIAVIRLTGKEIWKSNRAARLVAEVIQARRL